MKKIKLIASLMMLVFVCTFTSCSSSDDDDSKSVTIADNSHYFKIVYEFENIADGQGNIGASAGNTTTTTDFKINGKTNPTSTISGGEIPNSININKNTKTYTVETINKCYGLATIVTYIPETDEYYNSEKTTFTIKYYLDNELVKTDEGYIYMENMNLKTKNTVISFGSSNNGSYQIIAQ